MPAAIEFRVSSPGIAREDGRKRPYVPAISIRRALCNRYRDGRDKFGHDNESGNPNEQ
jgi:hypothetical protein